MWSSVSLPLAIGIMIIITGVLYSTKMLSSLNLVHNMAPWTSWVTQYQGDKNAKWIFIHPDADKSNTDLSVAVSWILLRVQQL